jgi:murein DD-endopeptidase MepM/ murein hydrolase activator NlpD
MAKVSSVIDTILAEAGGSTPAERLADMKAIASVIENRARQLGVSPEEVVSVQSEFNAFGKAFPPGVERYRALAARALKEVQESGPVHNATFYATPKAAHRLPDGLQPETETAGHQFYSDPEMRSIRTAQGFMQPDAGGAMLASYSPEKRASAEPSAFDALFGGYTANPQQSFAVREGILRGGTPANVSGMSGGLLSADREGYGSPFGTLGDRITSGFGGRVGPVTPMGIGSSNHAGVDMSLQANTAGYPVEASAGGVVRYAGPSRGYGNMVEIEHPDGMRTRYGHLQEVGNLAIGDEIARGTPVGMVGNTGRSRGPHLHFETLDEQGNAVDPRSVVDFNSEVRVPTPEERPTPWDSAVPMAVERQSLPDLKEGMLAETTRQTPSLAGAGVDSGFAGRFADPATVSQGRAELRDAMLGDTGVRKATDAEMASLQDQANQDRQALEQRMRGGILSLTPDQVATFGQRRENALGIISQGMSPTQATVSVPGQVDAIGGAATTANLVDPKDYASNVSLADQLTGISPTMTQSVSIAGMNPTTDISAPVSVNEYTGMLTNPGILSAEKLGMKPNQVKTVDVGLLNQPKTAGMGVVEGPVADGIQTPEAEVEQDPATTAQTKQQPSRLGQFAKKAGASLIGGVAGGALGGPVGAVIGGMLAREALGANNKQGGFLDGVKGLLGAGTGGQGAWAGIGTLNDLGQGAQASYGAWGGPQGTTATATDGSRITSLGNGLVSRIDRYGRETFHKDGDTWGGGGGWGNSGGFLGGLFGGKSMGDGSRSQADKARDSVGLY